MRVDRFRLTTSSRRPVGIRAQLNWLQPRQQDDTLTAQQEAFWNLAPKAQLNLLKRLIRAGGNYYPYFDVKDAENLPRIKKYIETHGLPAFQATLDLVDYGCKTELIVAINPLFANPLVNLDQYLTKTHQENAALNVMRESAIRLDNLEEALSPLVDLAIKFASFTSLPNCYYLAATLYPLALKFNLSLLDVIFILIQKIPYTDADIQFFVRAAIAEAHANTTTDSEFLHLLFNSCTPREDASEASDQLLFLRYFQSQTFNQEELKRVIEICYAALFTESAARQNLLLTETLTYLQKNLSDFQLVAPVLITGLFATHQLSQEDCARALAGIFHSFSREGELILSLCLQQIVPNLKSNGTRAFMAFFIGYCQRERISLFAATATVNIPLLTIYHLTVKLLRENPDDLAVVPLLLGYPTSSSAAPRTLQQKIQSCLSELVLLEEQQSVAFLIVLISALETDSRKEFTLALSQSFYQLQKTPALKPPLLLCSAYLLLIGDSLQRAQDFISATAEFNNDFTDFVMTYFHTAYTNRWPRVCAATFNVFVSSTHVELLSSHDDNTKKNILGKIQKFVFFDEITELYQEPNSSLRVDFESALTHLISELARDDRMPLLKMQTLDSFSPQKINLTLLVGCLLKVALAELVQSPKDASIGLTCASLLINFWRLRYDTNTDFKVYETVHAFAHYHGQDSDLVISLLVKHVSDRYQTIKSSAKTTNREHLEKILSGFISKLHAINFDDNKPPCFTNLHKQLIKQHPELFTRKPPTHKFNLMPPPTTNGVGINGTNDPGSSSPAP